jgi:hypothetical protein
VASKDIVIGQLIFEDISVTYRTALQNETIIFAVHSGN